MSSRNINRWSGGGLTPKVMHIASGDLWGGAEALVHALAKEQRRRNPGAVECVIMNPGRLAQELERDGVPVTILDESKQSLLELVGAVTKIRHRSGATILHSHRQKEHLVALLSRRLNPGSGQAALVGTIHGLPEPLSAKNPIRRWLVTTAREMVLRYGFDAVVGVSEEIVRTLRPAYPRSNLLCVHNGISPSALRTTARDRTPQRLHLVALGRLVPIKRFDRLAPLSDEFLKLTNDRPAITLAGEGPLWDDLRDLLCDGNSDRGIQMPGFVADTAGLLAGADGLVITSDHEGIPMAVLEALGSGLPVFGFRVGGLPEISEPGVPLYLVDPGDVGALAKAIVTHFTDHVRGVRITLPENWRFDIGQCASAYQRLYESL